MHGLSPTERLRHAWGTSLGIHSVFGSATLRLFVRALRNITKRR